MRKNGTYLNHAQISAHIEPLLSLNMIELQKNDFGCITMGHGCFQFQN